MPVDGGSESGRFDDVLLISIGRGGRNGREKTEHVWQDQVDTLDKARGAEGTLLDSHQQRGQMLRQGE